MRLSPSAVAYGLLLTLLALATLPGSALADPTPEWFSPASFWNRPLAPSAPIAANSAAYVAELDRQRQTAEPWINTDRFSVPVYRVGPGQPTVPVHIRRQGSTPEPALVAALTAVPLPSDAQPAAGTDHHLVAWQPSTDEMWEFWELRREGGEWVAAAGGAMRNVSANIGFFDEEAWPGATTHWGATATALPLVGGLITIEELREQRIEHALAFSIPEPSPAFVWPAQRSDGFDTAATAIPEGTLFRLPADLDLEALELPPPLLAIATAVQRWGMVVRDTAGCVCFYGEAPLPGEANPYPSLLEGEFPNNLLERFPWEQLEVVEPNPLETSGLALWSTFPTWATGAP
jgi:hypothetical protein